MANRMLGVGLDFTPPGMVRPATDEKKRLVARGKLSLNGVIKSAMEAGEFFIAAKDLCEHGEFLKLLKDEGLAPRTVQWAMKKFRDKSAEIAHLLDEDRPTKTGSKRDPGDDRQAWEKRIEAAEKFWRNELKRLSRLADVSKATVDTAYRSLEGLLTTYRQLNEAPIKPADPPRQATCDQCGQQIWWAGPNDNGSYIALDFEVGGGQFELIENRPVMIAWHHGLDCSKLWKSHHSHCKPPKKGGDDE